jgi:restriction endonuclease S subunit
MSAPALRFKEFSDTWVKKLILEVAPLQRGFDLPVSDIVNGKYPVVFSNGILKHHHEFKALAPGVVTGRSGTIGSVTYVAKDYWPHNTSLWVTDFKGNLPKFIYYFYNQFDLSRFGTGSGVPTLNRNDVHRQNVSIPSLPEQTKITNFLTAVDEKLVQITRKHDLLTQYKKGVMQQIFSQELRFKDDDGQGFPEWEEMSLADVGEIITGKTPSTADSSLWDGDIQFVTPTDIKDQKYQHETQRKVTLNTKLKVLPKNSIMFTCIASIGKMSLSVSPCITNQQINALITKVGFENEYIYYALLNITDFIKSTQANTTLPIINKTEFSKFVISVPVFAEQTKIAAFLTAIDDKIDTNRSQLAAAKQYKQGLLQQLFV